MTNPKPIVDMLYRGNSDADAIALRAANVTDDPAGSTLFGWFSRFDAWYRIDSYIEGLFLERTVAGSFKDTINKHRSTMVCSFDHGFDPELGDKPMGPIETLREDAEGPYYEVPLLDTGYNRDFILPALQGRTIDGRNLGSVLGASFRMRVTRDEWNMAPKKSTHNPDGIPERTIKEIRLYEFGPVVYPASPTATAGVRGLTDHYFARQLSKDGRAERAIRALGGHISASVEHPTGDETPTASQQHPDGTPIRTGPEVLALVARLRKEAA